MADPRGKGCGAAMIFDESLRLRPLVCRNVVALILRRRDAAQAEEKGLNSTVLVERRRGCRLNQSLVV